MIGRGKYSPTRLRSGTGETQDHIDEVPSSTAIPEPVLNTPPARRPAFCAAWMKRSTISSTYTQSRTIPGRDSDKGVPDSAPAMKRGPSGADGHTDRQVEKRRKITTGRRAAAAIDCAYIVEASLVFRAD